jgi:hypothetical protein
MLQQVKITNVAMEMLLTLTYFKQNGIIVMEVGYWLLVVMWDVGVSV